MRAARFWVGGQDPVRDDSRTTGGRRMLRIDDRGRPSQDAGDSENGRHAEQRAGQKDRWRARRNVVARRTSCLSLQTYGPPLTTTF